MRVAIGSFSGVVYRGDGPDELWADRPTFAFVPDEANEPWSEEAYAERQWPTLNAVGNVHTLGSEIWPNIEREASDEDMALPEGRHFQQYLQNHLAMAHAPEASSLS